MDNHNDDDEEKRREQQQQQQQHDHSKRLVDGKKKKGKRSRRELSKSCTTTITTSTAEPPPCPSSMVKNYLWKKEKKKLKHARTSSDDVRSVTDDQMLIQQPEQRQQYQRLSLSTMLIQQQQQKSMTTKKKKTLPLNQQDIDDYDDDDEESLSSSSSSFDSEDEYEEDEEDDDDDSSSVQSISTSSSTSNENGYFDAACSASASASASSSPSPSTLPTKEQFFDAIETPQQQGDESSSSSSQQHYDMEHFPELDLLDESVVVPDSELTDISGSSEEEETIESIESSLSSILEGRKQKYDTKEDEDVAVFKDLVKRMSLQSIVHILQGHVRQSNPSPAYLQTYADAAIMKDNQIVKMSTEENKRRSSPLVKKKKKKQFRWATLSDDKVRVVTYDVESFKDQKHLWLTASEMVSIRTELIQTVHYYRKHKQSYMNSIEICAKGELSEPVLEYHMKLLTDDSYARGLETHIVKCFFTDHRKAHSTAIIQEQNECVQSKDTYEMTSHCLRSQSLAYSPTSTNFAIRMAKCDEIEALKANIIVKWQQHLDVTTTPTPNTYSNQKTDTTDAATTFS